MKKIKCFLCFALLVLCISVFAQAAPIYNFTGLNPWVEVNKQNVNGDTDSLLCWAASASNALAWAGWPGLQADGVTQIASEGDIFSYFTANWPNATGNVMYAYEWWFDGVDADPNTNPDGTGASGFYTASDLTPCGPGKVCGGYYGAPPDYEPSEDIIWGYINDDRALEFAITDDIPNGFGHSMTIWGIDRDLDRLYFTDSDDGGVPTLRDLAYEVRADDYLYLLDYTNLYISTATDYRIDQVIRLNRNDAGLGPSLPNGGVIPEPSTGILLSLGLIALGYFSKKRK